MWFFFFKLILTDAFFCGISFDSTLLLIYSNRRRKYFKFINYILLILSENFKRVNVSKIKNKILKLWLRQIKINLKIKTKIKIYMFSIFELPFIFYFITSKFYCFLYTLKNTFFSKLQRFIFHGYKNSVFQMYSERTIQLLSSSINKKFLKNKRCKWNMCKL